MTATKPPPDFTINYPAPGLVQATLTHPDGATAQMTIPFFKEIRIDPETGEAEAILTDEARELVFSAKAGTLARSVADLILDELLSMPVHETEGEKPIVNQSLPYGVLPRLIESFSERK